MQPYVSYEQIYKTYEYMTKTLNVVPNTRLSEIKLDEEGVCSVDSMSAVEIERMLI